MEYGCTHALWSLFLWLSPNICGSHLKFCCKSVVSLTQNKKVLYFICFWSMWVLRPIEIDTRQGASLSIDIAERSRDCVFQCEEGASLSIEIKRDREFQCKGSFLYLKEKHCLSETERGSFSAKAPFSICLCSTLKTNAALPLLQLLTPSTEHKWPMQSYISNIFKSAQYQDFSNQEKILQHWSCGELLLKEQVAGWQYIDFSENTWVFLDTFERILWYFWDTFEILDEQVVVKLTIHGGSRASVIIRPQMASTLQCKYKGQLTSQSTAWHGHNMPNNCIVSIAYI